MDRSGLYEIIFSRKTDNKNNRLQIKNAQIHSERTTVKRD